MEKTRQALAMEWLGKIEVDGVNLTPWEEGFVQDMVTRAQRGREFTAKQIDVIEKIYADRTP